MFKDTLPLNVETPARYQCHEWGQASPLGLWCHCLVPVFLQRLGFDLESSGVDPGRDRFTMLHTMKCLELPNMLM